MKHFFAFCKRNRLFAALLAVELAVLCVLAAGLCLLYTSDAADE